MNGVPPQRPAGPLTIAIVAGEPSGDELGGALIAAMRTRYRGELTFGGVGGPAMAAAGMPSLFAMEELSIMGFASIARRLPAVLRRIRETATMIVAMRPDVLVLIDSPEFTHRVARRVRARAPSIPIVDYVSPSVWAWRPGRARAMRAYVDHVLALLPFEPAAHLRLGGPPCTYVGHPLTEHVHELRPNSEDAVRRQADPPVILVLPGSRRGEIRRLIEPFAMTLERVAQRIGRLALVLPTVPAAVSQVRAAIASWPLQPDIVHEPAQKHAAFRKARAALAASGTVTLELALAGVPTVAAYKVAGWEAAIARRLIQTPTAILANLVVGENVVPEFLQEDCVEGKLAPALLEVIQDTPERRRQLDAFARLDTIMEIGSAQPSIRAADIVFSMVRSGSASSAR